MRRSDGVVARARALVGTRFRPHGRGEREGLDCVGLVAAALGRDARRDYALRGGDLKALEDGLSAAGLMRGEGLLAGDVVVLRTGPGQLHLGVWTGDGLVHADAGLRRVVERPGIPPWPVVGAWRGIAMGEQQTSNNGSTPSTPAFGGGPPPRSGED